LVLQTLVLIKKMKRYIILVFILPYMVSCDTKVDNKEGTTKLIETTWYKNQMPLDSTKVQKLIGNKWLLFKVERIPDTISLIDLSKTEGLFFDIDTIGIGKSTFIFNKDGSCELVEKSIIGKWKIIDKKYLGISWNQFKDSTNVKGIFSIVWIKKDRLHLFKGTTDSNNIKIKNKYIFKKI
jgi:hypothetical protein